MRLNLLMKIFFSAACLLTGISCKFYNFTGGSVGKAKTFQVDFFQNRAPIIEPALDRDFTLSLQDLIQNQTNLVLSKSDADLRYSGEITRFDISPMSATADQTAAQNRLTIEVNVRFENTLVKKDSFEKRFSYFYDYPANSLLSSVKASALEEIFQRIDQEIFTASLANW